MLNVKCYAAFDPRSPLKPYEITRNEPGPNDLLIKVLFCGICHSDIHSARNEWGFTKYPIVPGHEIVGLVERLGESVTKFKLNDRVGVGCMVNSCKVCAYCIDGIEQFCNDCVGTYGGNLPVKD